MGEANWIIVSKDLNDEDFLDVFQVGFDELETKVNLLYKGKYHELKPIYKNRVYLTGISSEQFNQVETLLSKGGILYLKVT